MIILELLMHQRIFYRDGWHFTQGSGYTIADNGFHYNITKENEAFRFIQNKKDDKS